MQTPRFTTRQLTRAAVIAAIYVALSYLSSLLNLAFGPIQLRFSEALCVLPFLFPEAIPGLAIGCLVTNLLSPYGLLDIVFGTLASLLAALLTHRAKHDWTAALPPVFCNALIVGAVIAFQQCSSSDDIFVAAFCYNAVTIALGEALVCFALGVPLLRYLQKHPLRP